MYFFFQAEDGIRCVAVTGVQTCALPISPESPAPAWPDRSPSGRHRRRRGWVAAADCQGNPAPPSTASPGPPAARSEERRVGKECRSRWKTYHDKENPKDKIQDQTGRYAK